MFNIFKVAFSKKNIYIYIYIFKRVSKIPIGLLPYEGTAHSPFVVKKKKEVKIKHIAFNIFKRIFKIIIGF